MRRVRTVHFVRAMLNPTAMKGVILGLSLVAVFSLVSVHHVFTNMSNLGGLYLCFQYLIASFSATSFAVQAAMIVAIASGAWLIGDIVRNYERFTRSAVTTTRLS